jgi:hypothetical protein
MVVGCLMLLLLDQDDFLLLLHPLHGGGLLHLQDGHLVHVWPGKSALPSTLGPHWDDFSSSFGKASGWAPARLPGLLLLGVEHHCGHLKCENESLCSIKGIWVKIIQDELNCE